MKSEEQENLRVIYGHMVDITKVFLDWRHKVMSFTFTVVAALVAVSAWMYDHDLGRAIGFPVVFAAVLCVMAALFDHRNQQILYETTGEGPSSKRASAVRSSVRCLTFLSISTTARRSDELITGCSSERTLGWRR